MAEYSGPELCRLPAREAVRLLKAGEIEPADLLEASLARIAAVEPAINAVVTVCASRARQALRRLPADRAANGDEPGWLGGLPIGIKDLDAVAGVRCTFGSPAYRDFVPAESEPLVERLEARGAVIVGKTNTPEFGAGANTFNAVFGATRNPWDTRRNAGGSSGGAAASLATGETWLSHGSDFGGSLRTPAAYCGIVGLRPTPGRCGGSSPFTAFSTEGISGPMARDVGDIALFLDAMAGYDPREPITLDAPALPFQEALRRADARVRIAFSEDLDGFAPVEKEMRAILRRAMEQVARAGGTVEDACPPLPGLYETFVALRGVAMGSGTAYLPQEAQRHFKPVLRENVEFGKRLATRDIYEAMRQRTVLYQNMRRFLEHFDVLALPVVGLEPGPVEEEYPRFVDGQPMRDYIDWLRFAFLATATTLPAISVPVGFTASGMPVGIQLVGRPRGEAGLLRTARAVEEAVGFPRTPIDPVVRHAIA
jgi:amidase